jgi:predicted house-cleaning noncanonical NTP pyrophosphatase (MazG superfamily)
VTEVIFSVGSPLIDWSEVAGYAAEYGPKGAGCLALPRPWTPPFALIPHSIAMSAVNRRLTDTLGSEDIERLQALADERGALIVRSSVLGESIWDRGAYDSVRLNNMEGGSLLEALNAAASKVIASANGKRAALVIQAYVDAAMRGEFGNLLRISKTRDQWELNQVDRDGSPSRNRLNSQRDTAADPNHPIRVRAGMTTERLFGSIAAWLNNELIRGRSLRLNCEWVTDNRSFYLVQIDEEDEDVWGVNPLQIRILPSPKPPGGDGRFIRLATEEHLRDWDKLKVLEELWEPQAKHKPTLFFAPLDALPEVADTAGIQALAEEFRTLIGPVGIVVRTSVKGGADKTLNLPRSECLDPEAAARWCVAEAAKLGGKTSGLTFVAHRFVASRSSAWVRAEPSNPMVEIHSLWGLPDALQYCPYDIWEVHRPTEVATDYTEYKSDMLRSREDGGWEHARIKNEVARMNSINAAEARDLAERSAAIADRLGQTCHIMWFVGCVDEDGRTFNIPWYWTSAHETEGNVDRASYREIAVRSQADLDAFNATKGPWHRCALALKPVDLDLMRDNAFIAAVGAAALKAGLPVILNGSTLAHAYYQLRRVGCAVIAAGRKERSRIRKTTNLGKLVRDKVPERIASRQEHEVTRQVPGNLVKGFLLGKLVEEALEVREAASEINKREELGDLYEVFLALIRHEGVTLADVTAAADVKREKAGGFEQGLILMQTGIANSERGVGQEGLGQLIADLTSDDTVELPFSFFGFMEMDQPRSLLLESLGLRLDLTLKPDRIELRLVRSSEQLGLGLRLDPNPA